MNKIIILMIVLISILSIGDIYKTTVDSDYGFYKVRNLDHQNTEFTYYNHTLEIYVGDTVEWTNMANPEERLTIISDENLWSNSTAILPWSFRSYNYTFNNHGTYNFRLQGYPRLYQKVFVKETLKFDSNISKEKEKYDQITQSAISTPKSISVNTPTHELSKKSPGFELIFGIFALMFLSRKYV